MTGALYAHRVDLRVSNVVGPARRVDDKKQPVSQIGDHKIVENAAVSVGRDRIALTVLGETRDIRRNKSLQRKRHLQDVSGPGTKFDSSHMRNVE